MWVNGQSLGRHWPANRASEGCTKCRYAGTYREGKCLRGCGEASQKWWGIIIGHKKTFFIVVCVDIPKCWKLGRVIKDDDRSDRVVMSGITCRARGCARRETYWWFLKNKVVIQMGFLWWKGQYNGVCDLLLKKINCDDWKISIIAHIFWPQRCIELRVRQTCMNALLKSSNLFWKLIGTYWGTWKIWLF